MRQAYINCGVQKGRTIYVTGNLGRVGLLHVNGAADKAATIDAHISILLELIGEHGNIAFPTHSTELVGSGLEFDPYSTPTKFTLSEALRKAIPHERQFHPFLSTSVHGPDAKELVPQGIFPHCFGHGSPMAQLRDADCLHVSIGEPVRKTISAVHHCELIAGVPYRYVKAFNVACLLEGERKEKEFFLHVWYRKMDMKRDGNQKITDLPGIKNAIRSENVGRSVISSVPIKTFIDTTLSAMRRDPYIWLATKPTIRPWEE